MKDDARKEARISKKANRDITISAVMKQNNEEARLSFGVSTCSKKDQFVRAKGRILSTGRAASSHLFYREIPVDPNINRKELVKLFVNSSTEFYKQLVPAKPAQNA